MAMFQLSSGLHNIDEMVRSKRCGGDGCRRFQNSSTCNSPGTELGGGVSDHSNGMYCDFTRCVGASEGGDS